MTGPDASRPPLTRNQELVLATLIAADGPLGAYDILDRLREAGLRAPPQVYRALDRLQTIGLVHRLESLNAFVACSMPETDDHATVAFAICERCGTVTEFADPTVDARLAAWARREGFRLTATSCELKGVCAACTLG